MKLLKKILSTPFIILIRIYQLVISPWLGSKCRFTPTCSEYSLQAFKKFSPIKAFMLSFNRIRKCHPWGSSGYDPLP